MDNLSKEQIIRDYLKKQIELYKNEADFDNEYFNEQWIEETLKKIMVYETPIRNGNSKQQPKKSRSRK